MKKSASDDSFASIDSNVDIPAQKTQSKQLKGSLLFRDVSPGRTSDFLSKQPDSSIKHGVSNAQAWNFNSTTYEKPATAIPQSPRKRHSITPAPMQKMFSRRNSGRRHSLNPQSKATDYVHEKTDTSAFSKTVNELVNEIRRRKEDEKLMASSKRSISFRKYLQDVKQQLVKAPELYIIALVSGLSYIFVSYLTRAFATAKDAMVIALELSTSESVVVIACLVLPAIAGLLISSLLSEIIGRKHTIIVSSIMPMIAAFFVGKLGKNYLDCC